MTMIDVKILLEVRDRAKRGALEELESLLWFREHVEEWKAEKVLMRAYFEYAKAMMIARDTLRRKMAIIRNYAPDFLREMINSGVSWEHIETANLLAEKAKKTPKQLLVECVQFGDENGRVMTVEQLVTFALGETPKHPFIARLGFIFEQLGKFPTRLGWDETKTSRYIAWLEVGREFLS